MLDVFKAKASLFNKALDEDDSEAIAELGKSMVEIALDECSKVSTNQVVKNNYRKEAKVVMGHLSRYASKSSGSSNSGSKKDDNSVDPYYEEKEWFSSEVPDLSFKDIIGVQEVKDSFMTDVVAPLKGEYKELYKRFRGNEVGSQILLWGPPGTGKTHIVRCLAGALNCKIAVIQISEILASIVGVAEKSIRDIFAQASKLDRCIIFFDEIDAICSDRSSDDSRHTKSILTTLLTNMDGFVKTKKEGQLRIIVAATNLPWKLDSALKRGGRFENQIYVPLPDKEARKKFIELEIAKWPHEKINVDNLVEKLKGYSGADIKAIFRQVANMPLRRAILKIQQKKIAEANMELVTNKDCIEAIDSYNNSVSKEMLLRYKAYEMGISYEELIARLKK
jgi:SpoVK/Ycf46/Vps4 family AAA+-type ATPase